MRMRLCKIAALGVFGIGIVIVLASCMHGIPKPAPTPAGPPNILFVFTDDHGYQAISAYGSRVNQTPTIDRLAREGMLFRNCFVTNSICGPSRAVILTGKHSHLNGVPTNGRKFDGSQQTFPKLLQTAGYQTALIGKWHLRSAPTGFDYWRVLVGQGPYYNPPWRGPDGVEKPIGYTTDIITDVALDWLKEKRDPQKPFMLMYQHKAPHRNWLLIVTTYGHALQQPLFDIDGHTFTRLALIVFLLLVPVGNDRYSIDHWLLARKDKRSKLS